MEAKDDQSAGRRLKRARRPRSPKTGNVPVFSGRWYDPDGSPQTKRRPLRLWFTAQADDEPEGQADDQHQPPKITQFASGHFGETKRAREYQHQRQDDQQQHTNLDDGAPARAHGEAGVS